MKENRPESPFNPRFADPMRPGERVAALIYFPIHVFALPLLLPRVSQFFPQLSTVDVNLVYYIIGFAYTLILCRRFLRAGFDAALDRPGLFFTAMLTAFVLEIALSMIVSSLAVIIGVDSSPNNEAFVAMAPGGRGKLTAMSVFMAPVVEEILFRGLAFGALHRRSRAAAWIVSALAFSVYHVWQYALLDPALLAAAVLYLPASLALNWAYERSGSIWAPIAYHMLTNAIGMSALLG